MVSSKKSRHAGAVIAGVIGGLVAAAVLGFCGLILLRKRRRRIARAETAEFVTEPVPFPSGTTLFETSFRGPSAGQKTQSGYRSSEGASGKAREAALVSQSAPQTSASASAGNLADRENTGRSNGAGAIPPGAPLSETEVRGLRTEVENLRRVMQTMQEVRYGPPPGYQSEVGQ